MKLKVVKDHEDSSCGRCCLADSCMGPSHSGTQVIDGVSVNCLKDEIIYKEVEENMDIEDLKKSVEVWVWNINKLQKLRRDIVYIHADGSCIGVNGKTYEHYEEIKEPTWRPFNFKTDSIPLGFISVTIHSKIEEGTYQIISGISKDGFSIHGEWHPFDIVFQEWETLDGKPIGIKK